MAEEMVRRYKLEQSRKTEVKATQTGDFNEFMVYLDKTKTMRVYFSESYKDYVMCLHFSNNKRYIITKQMWKILRLQYFRIDHVLGRTS